MVFRLTVSKRLQSVLEVFHILTTDMFYVPLLGFLHQWRIAFWVPLINDFYPDSQQKIAVAIRECLYTQDRYILCHIPAIPEPVENWFLLVFAGPATDEILEVQIVRFVVFAGPAMDKILKVQIIRFVCNG